MTYSGITSGSKDFNPDPTPAYSDRLRDLPNTLEKGIDRRNQSVKANDQTRLLNAQRAGENMKALGNLSSTLGSVLEGIQEQRIKRFQTEATVFNELGIDTQEKLDAARAKQDELEAELEESSKAISQIKNIIQEEKSSPEIQKEIKSENIIKINSLEDLISFCSKKKEIKLKYELEKNVNLVKFEKNRIEISFNESLDKDFVKDLSSKLFEWTGERWIITLSKIKGEISIKQKKQNKKTKSIDNAKNSKIYKLVLEKFPDASLVDITDNKDEEK